MSKKLETNEDLVLDLMNYSPRGALGQVFVMEAIRAYAANVANLPPVEGSMIDGTSWKEVAEDVLKRLDAFYNRHYQEEQA